jgi:5-methylcytosine-specific restriction endonuclease McrA
MLCVVLDSARERRAARQELIERARATLRELVAESVALEPFPHGTFFDQLRHELLDLRAEHGDPLALERQRRRNTKVRSSVRARVYRRDDYTCRACGWRSPADVAKRRKANRSGLYLTVDHVIPLSEGGPNSIQNMQTLCSRCNPAKGHELPDDDAIARLSV